MSNSAPMEDTIWSGLQDWAGVDIKNQLIIFTVLAVWRENKPFFFWHSFFCKGLAEWPGAAVGEVPDWTMLLLLDNPSPLGAVSLCVTVWAKLCSPTADSWPCPMPCHARWEMVQTPLLKYVDYQRPDVAVRTTVCLRPAPEAAHVKASPFFGD